MKSIVTTVIDAGGRYGLHPNWKPFKGELGYYLFEPDSIEAKRLKEKYKARKNEIFIYPWALGQEKGELEINFFHNRAMSTSCTRKKDQFTFVGEKQQETKIVSKEKVPMTTIDDFCLKNKVELDFLKLDTEGTEFQILQGGLSQLKNNVLGVRCEVSFDYVFEGMPMFSTVHEFMVQQGFFLMNLSYKGQGHPLNEFVNTNGQYGVMLDGDAIWMRRKESLFSLSFKKSQDRAVKALKYAAFCLLNSASDVAIDVLLEARGKHKVNFDKLKKTQLYSFMDISIHKHFYSLKWQPGQSLKRHHAVYRSIFGKEMKGLHEFNQSLELNPD